MNDRQGRAGGVIAGAILIILGLLFLVRDTIDIDWGLIWPFFLIVPGAYVFVRALVTRDRRDRTGGFIGGGILLFLGTVFLLENYYALDWQKVWPFFLIIPGVGLLLGAFFGWGRREHRSTTDTWNQTGSGMQPPPPGNQAPPPPAPQPPAGTPPAAG